MTTKIVQYGIVTNMPGARQRSCKHLAIIMGAVFSVTCYSSLLGRTTILAAGVFY
jgi:hypothetical protein